MTQRILALHVSAKDAGRSHCSVAAVLLLAVTINIAAWALQPARSAVSSPSVPAAGNAVDSSTMRSARFVDFATMPPPKYPAAAFDAGIEGAVELQIDVDPGGVPQHIAVVHSKPAGVFDQAVLNAARQWRLKPAYAQGRAIASKVRVPVTFALDAPEQAANATDTSATRPDTPLSSQLGGCASPGCAMQETLR